MEEQKKSKMENGIKRRQKSEAKKARSEQHRDTEEKKRKMQKA